VAREAFETGRRTENRDEAVKYTKFLRHRGCFQEPNNHQAADENTSVLEAGRMPENQMRTGDEYQRAPKRWKKTGTFPIDAAP